MTTATLKNNSTILKQNLKPVLKTIPLTPYHEMAKSITPSIAKEFMDRNTKNRPINERNVDYLAKQMKEGKWKVNGETVKFSKTGVLLNSQHTLLAVIKSGVTIKIDVRYGLDDDVFPTLDTGRGRTSSDVLAIDGIENYTHISAMVNFIINFRIGHVDQAARSYSHGSDKITNDTVLEFAKKHNKSLQESRIYGYSAKMNDGTVSAKLLASFHYIFKKIKDAEKDANEFCSRVGDGVGLSKDSPIYVLRKTLQAADKDKKSKMNPNHRLALICKAWNLYRKNRTTTRLVVDVIKDGFPKPI